MAPDEAVEAAKLVFVECIARRIREKYAKQGEAATELKLDPAIVSKLLAGNTTRFSLAWLIQLSTKLGADISITAL